MISLGSGGDFWGANQPFASLGFFVTHQKSQPFQVITALRAKLVPDAPNFV